MRRVTVAVDGLWRWAFRGGSQRAELPHLGRRHGELAAGRRRLGAGQRPAGPAGRGERAAGDRSSGLAPGPPTPLGVAWSGAGAPRADTLRFDGSGRATVWLPPGRVPLPAGGRRRRNGGGGGVLGGAAAAAGHASAARSAGPRPRRADARPATGSGCSGSASWRSRASGSREGGWGCGRTGVSLGMANGRLTDRKEGLWSRIKRVAHDRRRRAHAGAQRGRPRADGAGAHRGRLRRARHGRAHPGARGRGPARQAQDRGRSAAGAREPARDACSTGASDPGVIARADAGAHGHPDGRRQRHGQDHHDRQARAAAPAGGPEGPARGGRHLPRGRHRPAPGLGRAARHALRGRRAGRRSGLGGVRRHRRRRLPRARHRHRSTRRAGCTRRKG